MSTSAKLATQLTNVLSGNAWYGNSVYTIIDAVSFQAAYQLQPGASHSIAAIVLHMLAWTEEATKRMQGKKATEPVRGDWPDPGVPDEQKWIQLVNYFKLANVELMQLISSFDKDQWQTATNDDRATYPDSQKSYEYLIAGLIQHHIYHAGQISLLNNMYYGK